MRTTFRLFLSCLFCFALPLANGYGSENDVPPDEQDRKAGDRMVLKIQDIEYAFRWCPAGTFTMGSPQGENGRRDSEYLHRVTLSKGVWMLETEVTQMMWEKIMGNNPNNFKGDKLPVECVSWYDCQEYIKQLNALLATTPGTPTGYKFSLPTEAQWEYACRAGTTTKYYFGDTLQEEQANFSGRLKDVGSYPANAWGLRDMHGNVCEWCWDLWFGDYSSDAVTDPMGATQGDSRVIRGGYWGSYAVSYRSAHRNGFDPSSKYDFFGLRLILSSSPMLLSAVQEAFRSADGNDKSADPRVPSFLAELPQPYNQMGTKVWEAIMQRNEAEADKMAQECIKFAETQGADPNVILTLNLTLGKLFLDASMFDSATRCLSEAAKRGGHFVYPLALCKAKSGDVDEGFSLLLDEIDRTPSVRSKLLMDILVLLTQVPPSKTMFEKIDGLMNRVETEELVSPETITALVDYWIIRGSRERTISLYEKGLMRDNLNETQAFVFQNNLARLYSEVRGDHAKALKIIDKALATTRDNPFLSALLDIKGLILINAGNPSAAIPVLQRAVELSGEPPIYCMHLAYALHLEGRDAESRQHFVAARDQLTPLVPTMTKENKAMYDALMRAHP